MSFLTFAARVHLHLLKRTLATHLDIHQLLEIARRAFHILGGPRNEDQRYHLSRRNLHGVTWTLFKM